MHPNISFIPHSCERSHSCLDWHWWYEIWIRMILLCLHITAYNRIKNERNGYWDDIGNACKVVASALGDPTSSTPQTNLHSNPCLALNSKDFSVEVLHLFQQPKASGGLWPMWWWRCQEPTWPQSICTVAQQWITWIKQSCKKSVDIYIYIRCVVAVALLQFYLKGLDHICTRAETWPPCWRAGELTESVAESGTITQSRKPFRTDSPVYWAHLCTLNAWIFLNLSCILLYLLDGSGWSITFRPCQELGFGQPSLTLAKEASRVLIAKAAVKQLGSAINKSLCHWQDPSPRFTKNSTVTWTSFSARARS